MPSGAPGGRPPLHHLPGAGRDSGYQPSSLLLPQKAPRLSLPSPQQPGFCLCHGMACRPEPSVLQFQNPALVIWFPREGSASLLSPVWSFFKEQSLTERGNVLLQSVRTGRGDRSSQEPHEGYQVLHQAQCSFRASALAIPSVWNCSTPDTCGGRQEKLIR